MTQPITQYCKNCGKPLTDQTRFCGRCGKPVPQAQASPPAPAPSPPPAQPAYQPPPPPQPVVPTPTPQPAVAPQSAEIIVGALPMGNQRSGFLGLHSEGFILVLTNLRILLVKQTSELLKENARLAKEAAKQSGKGFFGQWGAVIGSNSGQRYLQMQPQQILNETPGNSFILNNQIRSVRLKETYDPEEGPSEVRVTFETTKGKMQFTYAQGNKKAIKQTLQQTLGTLVR